MTVFEVPHYVFSRIYRKIKRFSAAKIHYKAYDLNAEQLDTVRILVSNVRTLNQKQSLNSEIETKTTVLEKIIKPIEKFTKVKK